MTASIETILSDLQDDIGSLNLSLYVDTRPMHTIGERYSKLVLTNINLRVEI